MCRHRGDLYKKLHLSLLKGSLFLNNEPYNKLNFITNFLLTNRYMKKTIHLLRETDSDRRPPDNDSDILPLNYRAILSLKLQMP